MDRALAGSSLGTVNRCTQIFLATSLLFVTSPKMFSAIPRGAVIHRVLFLGNGLFQGDPKAL